MVQGFQIKPKPGDATFRVYLKLVWLDSRHTTPIHLSTGVAHIVEFEKFLTVAFYICLVIICTLQTHRFWQKFEHFSFKIYLYL